MTITLTRNQWRTVHGVTTGETKRTIRDVCSATKEDSIAVELELAQVWPWSDVTAEIQAVVRPLMDVERVYIAFDGAPE